MEYGDGQFFAGMKVFDSNGVKVGSLVRYDVQLVEASLGR